MLAKLTAKNQLTLPKDVVKHFPGSQYFDVAAEPGRIVLTPVRIAKAGAEDEALGAVWKKIERLGITEKDVEQAVRAARRRK